MLDFEISKKLNIKAEKIDLDKSYYSFNPNTCYLTIELYLKKDVDIICPICGLREILVRGSKLFVIKTSFIDSNNVIVNVHRRIYKCRNNHSFIQDNPLSPEEKNKVQFVSMDLWDSYRDVAKFCFPKAKICADPFHVVKNIVMCFQYIRIAIMKI